MIATMLCRVQQRAMLDDEDATSTMWANLLALLEPYLSPKATWMLANHEVFQGFYYFHVFGADRGV